MKSSFDKNISPSQKKAKEYFGDILLLFILALPLRLAALYQTEYANGWDAYFYLIQIKSWIEEGAMHSSDSSLIYPLMYVLHWFSGDYVLSFKITSALLATSFVILIYIFGKKNTSYGVAIVLAFYFLWSPHLTWFAAQYPKNLLGVNLLLLLMLSFKSRWWWLPIVLLVVNYFGHRMTFVLSGIYVAFIFFGKIISQNQFLKKSFQQRKIELSVFVSVLFFLIAASQFFTGTLSFFDLERVSGALTNQPHFAPMTFFNEYNEGNRLSVFWKIEIGLSVVFYFVGVLLLFTFFSKQKHDSFPPSEGARGWSSTKEENTPAEILPPAPLQRGRNIVHQFALFILCSILIFPFLKWSLTSMSFRLVLVFIFLSPIFFMTTLHNLGSNFKLPPKLCVFVSVLLFIASFFSWKSYNPQLHDAPYEKYDRATQATFDFLKYKNPELIIAHNALAEYFTFTTGIDALPWQPEYEIEEGRLWRIAADVRLPIFRTYLSESDFKNIKRIGVNYFLIQESIWQKFRSNLRQNNEVEILEKMDTWRNPYKVRPDFLLNKKKK